MKKVEKTDRPSEVDLALRLSLLAIACQMLDSYLFFVASRGWSVGTEQFLGSLAFLAVLFGAMLTVVLLLKLRQGWARWGWLFFWSMLAFEAANATWSIEMSFGLAAIALGGLACARSFSRSANAWYARRPLPESGEAA